MGLPGQVVTSDRSNEWFVLGNQGENAPSSSSSAIRRMTICFLLYGLFFDSCGMAFGILVAGVCRRLQGKSSKMRQAVDGASVKRALVSSR